MAGRHGKMSNCPFHVEYAWKEDYIAKQRAIENRPLVKQLNINSSNDSTPKQQTESNQTSKIERHPHKTAQPPSPKNRLLQDNNEIDISPELPPAQLKKYIIEQISRYNKVLFFLNADSSIRFPKAYNKYAKYKHDPKMIQYFEHKLAFAKRELQNL